MVGFGVARWVWGVAWLGLAWLGLAWLGLVGLAWLAWLGLMDGWMMDG